MSNNSTVYQVVKSQCSFTTKIITIRTAIDSEVVFIGKHITHFLYRKSDDVTEIYFDAARIIIAGDCRAEILNIVYAT